MQLKQQYGPVASGAPKASPVVYFLELQFLDGAAVPPFYARALLGDYSGGGPACPPPERDAPLRRALLRPILAEQRALQETLFQDLKTATLAVVQTRKVSDSPFEVAWDGNQPRADAFRVPDGTPRAKPTLLRTVRFAQPQR